jgi:hypothetical protein
MGSITLTVEGTTVGTVANGGGVVLSKEVSETDSGRLIMAYARTYADRFKNEDGTPRQPSIDEVLEHWFDGIVAGCVAHVLNVEREVAAEQAKSAVAPISVTSI